ncbi:MAG: hypothetical protein ABWY48_10570 [Pseudoxanthomonas sp.]
MRINRVITLLACAFAAGPCLAEVTEAPAQGQAVQPWPVEAASLAVFADELVVGESASPAPAEPASAAALGTPMDTGELERLRGGESKVDNEVVIDGTVEGNTADHTVSGPNGISGGSFANASGINTVIQNTGNNVLIQNGMVVNVQFVAPPSP